MSYSKTKTKTPNFAALFVSENFQSSPQSEPIIVVLLKKKKTPDFTGLKLSIYFISSASNILRYYIYFFLFVTLWLLILAHCTINSIHIIESI